MKGKTMGSMISTLRKKRNMTQLQLATMMNVTDKAVSKWERDLSYPDINSLPKLAECLEISVEELKKQRGDKQEKKKGTFGMFINFIFKVTPIIIGMIIITRSIREEMNIQNAVLLLAAGLVSVSLATLNVK